MRRLRTRLAGRSCWLIARHTTCGMDVFTTRLCGESKALVVFGFQEEAEMFLDLRLGGFEDRWKMRQTSVGELVSILCGPCADTQEVVLDPVPEIHGEALGDHLRIPRNDFLWFLLGREVSSNLSIVPSQNHGPREDGRHHGHVA